MACHKGENARRASYVPGKRARSLLAHLAGLICALRVVNAVVMLFIHPHLNFNGLGLRC